MVDAPLRFLATLQFYSDMYVTPCVLRIIVLENLAAIQARIMVKIRDNRLNIDAWLVDVENFNKERIVIARQFPPLFRIARSGVVTNQCRDKIAI